MKVGYDDVQVIYIDTPDPGWPDLYGTIDAPWVRERWNWDERVLLSPTVKFSTVSLYEPGSKLYLHIYDDGRHVGLNETMQLENEIEGAYYVDLGNVTFIMLPSNVTDFEIMVDASGAHELEESFEIRLTTANSTETIHEKSMQDTIRLGEQKTYEARLDEETWEVILIPEFSSWIVMLSLMITGSLTTVLGKRKMHALESSET